MIQNRVHFAAQKLNAVKESRRASAVSHGMTDGVGEKGVRVTFMCDACKLVYACTFISHLISVQCDN